MRKVILITGTGRSGSTLLDMMLGNDPKGMSLGEVNALFRPYRPHHLLKGRNCFCENEGCTFWRDMKKGGEKNLYGNIFDKTGVEFIADSSKNPLWVKDQIKYSRNMEYEVHPVIIYKTPLEFAYSKFKRDNLSGWKNRWIRLHKRLFAILDDFMTVKYQKLAKDPSTKLKELCDNLGIEYFDGKEEFWNNKAEHFLFGSDTVRYSKKLVYYKEQYDEEKLEDLKEIIKTDDEALEKVGTVLDAYEVGRHRKFRVKFRRLKNELSEIRLFTILRTRSKNTRFYHVNRLMRSVQGAIGSGLK